MPIYSFTCIDCGHVFDALQGREVISFPPCLACGSLTLRQQVYRIGFTGFARTPVNEREIRLGAYTEASNELAYQHERAVDATQNQNLASPPLWQMAKAKAKKLMKAGVKDSLDYAERNKH